MTESCIGEKNVHKFASLIIYFEMSNVITNRDCKHASECTLRNKDEGEEKGDGEL
jgi:hypothetical protein